MRIAPGVIPSLNGTILSSNHLTESFSGDGTGVGVLLQRLSLGCGDGIHEKGAGKALIKVISAAHEVIRVITDHGNGGDEDSGERGI